MDLSNKKCLIGMPSGSGFVPTMVVQSLLRLHKPLACAFITVERQRIDKARNYMVQQCLSGGFDYLLMIDDDNPVEPETLEKLIKADKDIVSAIILSRNADKDGVHSICAFYSHTHKIDGKKLKLYNPIVKFRDEDDLHKVDAVGTGCILIKREVLLKMFTKYPNCLFEFGDTKFKKPFIFEGTTYDRRTMSEDCEFSERAIKCGFKIYLDKTVRPLHISVNKVVQFNNDKE